MWNKCSLAGIALGCLLAAACEKALMPKVEPATAANTFDYLWQRFDEQYSMFDVKGCDWQTVYDSLRPKIKGNMTSDSLFAVCAAMLNTLHDGHVNLYSSYDISHSDSIYYRFYANNDIDFNAVVLGYLGVGYHTTGGVIHGAICDGRVIYMRYPSFSNTIGYTQLRHIVKSYPHAQGIILDLRGNGGGNLANVHTLLKLMPSHGQMIYRSQIKTGPGHDDFAPLESTFAPTIDDSLQYRQPVVVLIDRGCFSATSTFAIATQAYDNMVLMGDTTSGGMGLPAMGVLPNGWRYRLSVTRTLALDGKNYENGVPPEIHLRLDRQAALSMHRDNIIDSASRIILAGRVEKH